MKNVIGRKSEIKRLSEYMNSGKAEFVVVYGRRRVGKTFLVREFFDNKFTFYFSGAENATKNVQLFNFNAAINNYSHGDYPLVDNWQSAFLQLEKLLNGIKKAGRKVIFIDE
jgi:AAA+ ATPase superfamily predicted ATPase